MGALGVGLAWVRLGAVLRVGVGVGVEEAGIAAEGAEDVGGGFVAVEEVHLDVVVPRAGSSVFSLEDVEAGLGEAQPAAQ